MTLVMSGNAHASPPNDGNPTFNRDIRPILSENCFLCHGQDPEHRGAELRLDIRENAIAPRDDGPAIVPGNPAESTLIKRIMSDDPDIIMPPPKSHLGALKPQQIDTLKKWIKNGAVYEAHWAFVPPVKAPLPQVGSRHPVDAFIRERLQSAGLSPSPEAPAETLVRRVYLDLTGLPPSLDDLDRYRADTSPDRWQRLIGKLMASPHFAERLAMPWLDAARYSDTHGFSIDDHRDMWGWRDWVTHAFQRNQPYDQFLAEQIAGDLIPRATPDQIAATGFLRNNMNTHEGGTIAEEYRVAQTIDKVDAVATSMLGLTLKCCQCHDHKFDPISQKEYYQFYAFFNASSEPGKGGTNGNTKPVMNYTSPLAKGGLDGVKTRIAELEYLRLHPSPAITAARKVWESTPPKSAAPAVLKILNTQAASRTPDQWKSLNTEFIKSKSPSARRMAMMIQTIDVEISVLQREIKRGQTTVMVMDHHPGLRKTHILERGAYDQPGAVVSPGTPSALPSLTDFATPENSATPTRLDLARWVTHPKHPLTARVAVNRTWQMIFGRGIVETAGDFGNQGSWPTHPELLDWLAVDFVENGWDIRQLLATILSSETYRQSAVSSAAHLAKDPRNTLLARSPRPRLAAEIIRDQALATSGLLNPSIGGPGVHPPQPDLWSEISHFGYGKPFTAQIFLPGRGPSTRRRSLYTFWKRTSPPPAMAIFDAPTRETCAVVRGSTNTPLQALVLMNEPQFVEAGMALGLRMIQQGGTTPATRLAYGFRLATGRTPTPQEAALLTDSLDKNTRRYTQDPAAAHALVSRAGVTARQTPELAAYTMVGSLLLNLDELISRP